MRFVEPQVFLVGETMVHRDELERYLQTVGAEGWSTDAPTDGEHLTEAMGRLCYRSWGVGLNANVRRVREGNAPYLANVIGSGHGSVFEHVVLNFILANVSRVFTHELVRHRAGTAISQESLRFVRLTDMGFWLPTVIRENDTATALFVRAAEEMEALQATLAQLYGLDEDGVPFHKKKIVTSAMRRIAPDGVTTVVGWSANLRALRHIITMRTHPSAEEEIRLVFGMIAKIVVARYPNAFFDFTVEMAAGLPWYKPEHPKI